jgi:hypothetical protein
MRYDTLFASDVRGVNTLAQAARIRATPLIGPPSAPGILLGRFRYDEKRFVSGRLSRAENPCGESPGPKYALPSTFLAAVKPVRPRAQLNAVLPRSNASAVLLAQSQRGNGSARPDTAASGWGSERADEASVPHVVIGCDRARIRPASASVVRRYSSSTYDCAAPPTFKRMAVATAGTSTARASSAVYEQPSQAATPRVTHSQTPGHTPRQTLRQTPSQLDGSGAQPLAASWRSASAVGSYSIGISIGGPGRAPPLRSAFVQPFGNNKASC